jgi:hypothetical protein
MRRDTSYHTKGRRQTVIEAHQWPKISSMGASLSLRDHVADLRNGGRRRLARRRVAFTCEKKISQRYVTQCVIYSLYARVAYSLAPFRSL